ncbi:MAG: MSMEG_1061 family FMN-dependent PPOX-type flavoprotein [Myxococcota bacterium]
MSQEHQITTVAQLRERMGTASPATSGKIDDRIDRFAREFIERSPFLLLSTADAAGHQDVSPKGDDAGFVAILDDHTLLVPDRKGNKLLMGLENILENPQVGLLFLVPGCEETLRVNGRATISADPDVLSVLAARGQDALVAIRVTVEEVFFHCAKAFRRSSLWKPETWTPHKVSFGEIFAERLARQEDREMIDNIDAAIEQDYQENL